MGIETFLYIIVILAILGIAWWALSQLPLPEPLRIVAVVVIAFLAIALLLQLAGGGLGMHLGRGCP